MYTFEAASLFGGKTHRSYLNAWVDSIKIVFFLKNGSILISNEIELSTQTKVNLLNTKNNI